MFKILSISVRMLERLAPCENRTHGVPVSKVTCCGNPDVTLGEQFRQCDFGTLCCALRFPICRLKNKPISLMRFKVRTTPALPLPLQLELPLHLIHSLLKQLLRRRKVGFNSCCLCMGLHSEFTSMSVGCGNRVKQQRLRAR